MLGRYNDPETRTVDISTVPAPPFGSVPKPPHLTLPKPRYNPKWFLKVYGFVDIANIHT